MKKKLKEEKKSSLMLNEGRTIYIYEDEQTDFIKSSNIPHFNVEDNKNWVGYLINENSNLNPNLIGQIDNSNDGVIFSLCFKPLHKKLNKHDLKSIIKGIEYIEDFIKQKK